MKLPPGAEIKCPLPWVPEEFFCQTSETVLREVGGNDQGLKKIPLVA